MGLGPWRNLFLLSWRKVLGTGGCLGEPAGVGEAAEGRLSLCPHFSLKQGIVGLVRGWGVVKMEA